MLTMNGTDYRLCLLDTNAISEMVKRPPVLRRFLAWAHENRPWFVPCFSPFTLLELRRSHVLYREFIERFGPIPCLLLKSHEQLLEDEVRNYPNPSTIDPTLLGFAVLGGEGNQMAKVLPSAFGTDSLFEQERMWNESQDEIVEGIGSLVPNFPPERDTYTHAEVRLFLEFTGLTQLFFRAPGFAEKIVGSDEVLNVDAFPSLKATGYTVFHKFYSDRTRKPTPSDAFDIIISAATPYVDAVVTENHQAEVLRKTMRQDDFVGDLSVFTLKDFREAPP
jgi:hypothetical protein